MSPIEMLLWNVEPCPGPPTRDYPGTIENAAYRLIALGVPDVRSAEICDGRYFTDFQRRIALNRSRKSR